MKNPVILMRFYDRIKLQLALSFLTNKGIEAEVIDLNAISEWNEGFDLSGAKILVADQDYQEGMAILVAAGFALPEDSSSVFFEIKWLNSFSKILPIVGKGDKEIRMITAASLLLIIPFLMVIAYLLSNS